MLQHLLQRLYKQGSHNQGGKSATPPSLSLLSNSLLTILRQTQESCIDHCTQKWLKHSERIGARFQEENLKQAQAQQGKQ